MSRRAAMVRSSDAPVLSGGGGEWVRAGMQVSHGLVGAGYKTVVPLTSEQLRRTELPRGIPTQFLDFGQICFASSAPGSHRYGKMITHARFVSAH